MEKERGVYEREERERERCEVGREHSKCPQEALLVTTARDVSCQSPLPAQDRPVRMPDTNTHCEDLYALSFYNQNENRKCVQ